MTREGFHENSMDITRETRDLHRALVSLGEELDAVDAYRQRADACRDGKLEAIMRHNMHEELEHAALLIDWLQRRDEHFRGRLQRFLSSEEPVTEFEAGPLSADDSEAGDDAETGTTIGSLKERIE
jgi:hypothetical protein